LIFKLTFSDVMPMKSLAKYLILVVFAAIVFGGCSKQEEPKRYRATAEELRWVNEMRVLIVELDQKWGKVGTKYW